MTVRLFVNERGVDAPAGATVLDAVRAFDPALAARIEAGEGGVTDARGLPVALDAPVGAGTILRAAVSARTASGAPHADT
jgi:hypothetical protein